MSSVPLPISVHGYFSNMHIDLNNSSNIYIYIYSFATFQFSAIILKLETFNVNDHSSLSYRLCYTGILRTNTKELYPFSYRKIKKFLREEVSSKKSR